jgi:predicted dehydrogenase
MTDALPRPDAPRPLHDKEYVNVAVVGLGYWGPNLLRVFFDVPGARVTHLCDLDADRLSTFSERYPGVQTTTDFNVVLEDPDVDAVVLATPVFTHFDLASKCLEAGKHTLVEKPLAPSTAKADALLEKAAAADRVIMCGHTFIYSPPVRAVKGLLDRGELGDIFFVSASRVNLGLHQRDVSVIWDLGPHDFSILLYWLEERPEWVSAVGRDSVVPGISDVAFINLKFPSGILANVELSWLAPSKLRRTVIVGSEKMVIYEDPETFGEYQLSYRTGDILSLRTDTVEPLNAELQDFISAVRHGTTPAADSRLARDVVRLVEEADRSLSEGAAGRHCDFDPRGNGSAA